MLSDLLSCDGESDTCHTEFKICIYDRQELLHQLKYTAYVTQLSKASYTQAL